MAKWIESLAAMLATAEAFRGCALRAARRDDEEFLFALHRSAMRDYVEAAWGWDERWQRDHFAATYAPRRHAVIVRIDPGQRRDIELVPEVRNQGIGTAVLRAVLMLAEQEGRAVELLVLKHNPAQRLYARLGFRVIADDGARLAMRAP